MAGKPNILIIWGDDIGYWNISAYSKGVMGYKTPNIDRIAKRGYRRPRLTALEDEGRIIDTLQ